MAGAVNYKSIDDKISQEIQKMSLDVRVSHLFQEIQQKEKELQTVATSAERQTLEKHLDVYKNKLEEFVNKEPLAATDWEGYPDFNDDAFNFKIYNKEEFNRFMIPQKGINSFGRVETLEFKKSPTQNFIGTYMSTFTPYNSLLLWLGVGVGKTCSAITAAENYRTEGGMLSRSKIMVLLPSNSLIQGWKTQIFNLSKELKKPNKNVNVQCTGDTFQSELPFLKTYPLQICDHGRDQSNCDDCFENMQKKVNKMINKYYVFLGYRKFANIVKEDINRVLLNKPNREYLKIDIIRKKYSNHIFILDEVHLTREHGSASKESKDIAEVLELIARYGVNNKFILASATPMYNSADEIIDILNIMLLNDKRAPIDVSQVFRSDGYELTRNGAAILKAKSRGYISFLRGENPITFPVKIYPYLNKASGDAVSSYVPNPKYSVRGSEKMEINNDEKIKQFSFIKCPMSQIQYATYQKAASETMTNPDEAERDRFSIPSTLASNIVYPLDDSGTVCSQGEESFKKIFTEVSHEQYKYTQLGKKLHGAPFLDDANLIQYSTKFYSILQLQKSAPDNSRGGSEGICFFFSKYLVPGIVSLALMLDQHGYARFVVEGSSKSEHMLVDAASIEKKNQRCFCGYTRGDHPVYNDTEEQGPKNHKFKQGRYIFLTGSTPKPTLDALINESNYYDGPNFDKNNLWGQHVKFVLGSTVMEQGINLYNVREVHIIDPWHHLNRTEQVVGRAIRNFSHKNLPPEKRNVSVYLYCATIPSENERDPHLQIETTDEKTYRNAYTKAIKIAYITRLLKKNAVDCLLNKNGNQLTKEYFGNRPMKIITSQGKQLDNMYYGDTDGDIMCDFEKCAYSCDGTPLGNYAAIPHNTDTFDEILMTNDLHQGKQFINRLFLRKNAYTIDEIITLKNKLGENMSNQYLFRAITEMIQKEESIFDKYHREGFIIYKHPYYIFQPFELKSDNTSLYVRSTPLPERTSQIVLSDDFVKIKKTSASADGTVFIENFKVFCNKGASEYIKKETIYRPLAEKFNQQFLTALSNQRGSSAPCCELGFELLIRYFIFCVIDRLSFDNKQALITHVLKRYIQLKASGSKFPSDNLEQSVWEMYTHPPRSSKNAIFDLDKPNPKFRLYKMNSQGQAEAVYFEYDGKKETYAEITSATKIAALTKSNSMKDDDLRVNSNLYGYISEQTRLTKAKQQAEKEVGKQEKEVKFYLVDKREHEIQKKKDLTDMKKSDITGSVCGTSTKTIDKEYMVKIIFDLLQIDKPTEQLKSFMSDRIKVHKEGQGHFTKKTDNATENIYANFAEKGALCELIEILLRHRQYISSTEENFFFNFEEWEFKRALDEQHNESVQEAQPKKRGRPKKDQSSSD